ncbi:hypothetical protein [Fimbriiglobus ruber]|uniref:Uncharacterized protein n=1 Tax=Fimbriiglobus ruber TaxID=1908690 RepID=A0A225DGY2_9BACT|nr:hypothetical protein [Fimbriiglobus ruber]OWK37798.1 hypothetical protein FRUB_06918 [Fimbriiglobus ruber]
MIGSESLKDGKRVSAEPFPGWPRHPTTPPYTVPINFWSNKWGPLQTFAGWEGDTKKTWRIEDGAIVGGSWDTAVPRNEFL